MKALHYLTAARRIVALWLVLSAAVLLYGCATPVLPVGTAGAETPTAPPMATATAVAGAAGTPTVTATAAGPTATPVSATALQLTNAVCVCHVQNELGAPPVATVAQVAPATIGQTVRQGRGQMPAWSAQNLSDEWLAAITAYVRSVGG